MAAAKSLVNRRNMEVAVGLEAVKTGFADQRLDRFGIATKPALNPVQTLCKPVPNSIPKAIPKLPLQRLFTPNFPFVNY